MCLLPAATPRPQLPWGQRAIPGTWWGTGALHGAPPGLQTGPLTPIAAQKANGSSVHFPVVPQSLAPVKEGGSSVSLSSRLSSISLSSRLSWRPAQPSRPLARPRARGTELLPGPLGLDTSPSSGFWENPLARWKLSGQANPLESPKVCHRPHLPAPGATPDSLGTLGNREANVSRRQVSRSQFCLHHVFPPGKEEVVPVPGAWRPSRWQTQDAPGTWRELGVSVVILFSLPIQRARSDGPPRSGEVTPRTDPPVPLRAAPRRRRGAPPLIGLCLSGLNVRTKGPTPAVQGHLAHVVRELGENGERISTQVS